MEQVNFRLFLHIIFLCGCCGHQKDVTIFQNGTIYTCEDSFPQAEAMVVSEGKILYEGDSQNLESYKKGDYKLVDVSGKTILPGFIESHTHPACYGFMEAGEMLVIDGTVTKEQILHQLKNYLQEHPEATHILGQGYGLSYLGLSEGETPTAKDLDEISATIPIMLYDEGCHSGWANSVALKLAGVNEGTPDPLPGVHYYVRYPGTRIPTGYLCENTAHIVANALPFNTEEKVGKYLKLALDNYTNMGFTAVFDAGDIYNTTYQAVKQLQDNHQLNLYYQKAYWTDQTLSVSENITRLEEMDKRYSHERDYTVLYTDEWLGYNAVDKMFYHYSVDHGKGKYVDGRIYTNTIEGFWSIFKRGIIGIYHHISKKHLQLYANEFTFRYNTRKIKDSSKFKLLLRNSYFKITYLDIVAA